MNDKIDGTVDNVAFGGEAVLHTSEGVVFVHDALPSEFISAKITQQKRKFSRGELLQVENPHPRRIPPKCPIFSVCGGCQLQHADYSLQVELKRQWIKDSLQRIGGLRDIEVPPIAPAKHIWEYRRHITLHIKVEGTQYKAIFHGRNPAIAVQPKGCPIFSEVPLNFLHETIAKFPIAQSEEGRVQIMKIEEGKHLYTFHFRNPPKGAWEIVQGLLRTDPQCGGVKLKTAAQTFSVGAEEGNILVAGMKFIYSPEAFVQTHPDQSEAIYQRILQQIQTKKWNRVLDLYGGIGVTASLIAKEGIPVTSVELNRAAVQLAKRNFAANGLNNGEFICGDVGNYVKKNSLNRFDLIIANPPREGIAPDALKLLAESKKDILLISCMPTTLARDLKLLTQSGYTLEWVEGYDMFPQTSHMETVVFCKANWG